MTIIVNPDEFEEEYRTPWKQELIKSPSIDYATNAIHGWFENKEVIIFRFKDYGFIHDNRFSKQQISIGPAGIMINVQKTRNE